MDIAPSFITAVAMVNTRGKERLLILRLALSADLKKCGLVKAEFLGRSNLRELLAEAGQDALFDNLPGNVLALAEEPD